MKRGKASLPVNLRRSKTSLLKFPNIYMPQLYITFLVQYKFFVLIAVGVLIWSFFSINLIKQCALWISYELVLTSAGFVVKMSDMNSIKCSLASIISLVFLCSVCSVIFDKACRCASENTLMIFFFLFCFFMFSLLISWNNIWAREIYYGQMIKKRSCLV